MPLSEADRWLTHFSSCSPCFQEFTRFRKQAVVRRHTQIWLAAAAVFIFAIAGWFWVRTKPPVQTAAVVVLDLRGRAKVRGENPPEINQLPLEVPRNAKMKTAAAASQIRVRRRSTACLRNCVKS